MLKIFKKTVLILIGKPVKARSYSVKKIKENAYYPLSNEDARCCNWWVNSERGFETENKIFKKGNFNAELFLNYKKAIS